MDQAFRNALKSFKDDPCETTAIGLVSILPRAFAEPPGAPDMMFVEIYYELAVGIWSRNLSGVVLVTMRQSDKDEESRSFLVTCPWDTGPVTIRFQCDGWGDKLSPEQLEYRNERFVLRRGY